MAFSTNREAIINEMVSDMDFGLTRGDVMARFIDTWQLSTRTFDRYWQTAKTRFEEEQLEVRRERVALKIDAEANRAEYNILNKFERMEILSSIADGSLSYNKQVVTKAGIMVVVVTPSNEERRSAIAELNKMDGDYAPLKTDITTAGKSVSVSPTIVFKKFKDDEQ